MCGFSGSRSNDLALQEVRPGLVAPPYVFDLNIPVRSAAGALHPWEQAFSGTTSEPPIVQRRQESGEFLASSLDATTLVALRSVTED